MQLLKSAVLLAVLALAAPAAAAAQEAPPAAPLPTATLPPEIDRVLRDYERGWRAGDEAALAGLFAEDGFILQNGQPPVRGRANIQQAYAGSSGPLRLRPLGYAADGSVGWIVGVYGTAMARRRWASSCWRCAARPAGRG